MATHNNLHRCTSRRPWAWPRCGTEPMKLLTKGLAARLPPLGGQDGLGYDAVAHIKLFTPDAQWTWYATEYDPEQRLLFGLVIGFEQELGYFSLDEIEAARGPLGLPIERDSWFRPTPLRDCDCVVVPTWARTG
jgi:hypothetical protein